MDAYYVIRFLPVISPHTQQPQHSSAFHNSPLIDVDGENRCCGLPPDLVPTILSSSKWVEWLWTLTLPVAQLWSVWVALIIF